MSGLLHRMAARAAGTAVAIRADVGSRAAVGDAPADGIGFQAVASGVAVPVPAMAASSPVVRPTAWRADVAASDPADASAPATDAPRPVAGRTEWPAAASSTPATASMPMADAVAPLPLGTPSRPAAGPAPVPGAAPDGADRRVVQRPARSAKPADANVEPAPLLPVGPQPAPLAAAPTPSRRAASPGSGTPQGEADTEVHIHIGRIDVTAIPEAPPPRRRTAPAPAPLSLDGYLAHRGRA